MATSTQQRHRITLPLGRKALTLTTTFTLPPALSGVLLPMLTTDSLARSDGADADDLILASEATPGNARGSSAMSLNNCMQYSTDVRKRN